MEMRAQKWTAVCKEFSMSVFQIRGADIHHAAKMLGLWLAIWKIEICITNLLHTQNKLQTNQILNVKPEIINTLGKNLGS